MNKTESPSQYTYQEQHGVHGEDHSSTTNINSVTGSYHTQHTFVNSYDHGNTANMNSNAGGHSSQHTFVNSYHPEEHSVHVQDHSTTSHIDSNTGGYESHNTGGYESHSYGPYTTTFYFSTETNNNQHSSNERTNVCILKNYIKNAKLN